jgi:hypothetical protein
MEVSLANSWAYEVQPLWMEVVQIVAFFSVIYSLKAMSPTLHICLELKSLDYEVIWIELVNYLPTKFNGDILFEFPPICHPLGQLGQLQGMDKKFDGHAWCKLQTSNIHNSFRLGFRMTKCLGHLWCQNDFYPLFQRFSTCNEVFWNGDSSQLPIFRQCFMKSPIYIISCKLCDSSPTSLQTCSSKMYYVVHKFSNLSRVVIHLGIHAHLVANKCRESF